MANNPFQTPTGTLWALPPLVMGTLFNTSDRVTRLQSRWNSSSGIFATLFSTWNSGSLAPANNGFGHALKSLATNSPTEATNAYNAAIAESFVQEAAGCQMYVDSSPYVYAWCKGNLTGTQNTNLITKIESNNTTRENTLATLGKFLLDGPGNGGGTGISGYIFGVIAINGQSGATDRRTNLRNLVQNLAQYLTETYGDGWWGSYDFIASYVACCIIAYHIATGETALLTTRCPWFAARGEVLCRMLSGDLNHYFQVHPHNCYVNGSGVIWNTFPDEGWCAAMQADITKDPLMSYVQQQMNAHSTPSIWTHLQPQTDPTWIALLMADQTITPTSPAAAGTQLSRSYPITGIVEMRAGWNPNTDLVVDYCCGPTAQNDHNNQKTSSLMIRVGGTQLIKSGYVYGGRPSNWENAAPPSSTEVGGFTMCKSGISFTPSATQATREDRNGSATISAPASSAASYPLSNTLTNGVRQTWAGGTLSSFDNSNAAQITKVVGDFHISFPQITSGNTTVGFVPGLTSDVGTVVLWDQFVAPGTIDHIRRNFFSFGKPTISGEAVLQGGSTAGVLTATSDHVVITNGSYQVTIQMVSTMSGINLIGGLGYEAFYDGYGATGGANMDFLPNTQAGAGDSKMQTNWLYLQGQWRTSFLTTQATAGGEMVFVLTVQAIGGTAPVYTRTTALALLNPNAASVIMPGYTQYWNAKLLNASTGKTALTLPTLYAAAFTTVGSDSGSGFVEPSGNGYQRKATSGADWNLATPGSPTTATNANDISFNAATGAGWGVIQGIGYYDAISGGNLINSDYLGGGTWMPFTCTLASPGVITCEGHGLTNGDQVAVTTKFGGVLPVTGGSWGGLLTVANVTTNTFTVGVNTTSVGSGSVKKVVTQQVDASKILHLPAGQQTFVMQ